MADGARSSTYLGLGAMKDEGLSPGQAPVTSQDLPGSRATVMGLGLNGGGVSSAKFLVSRGCSVTVTDLKSEEALAKSIAKLDGLPIRFVLGRHEESDFRNADIVVKNPAVRSNSPLVALARRVETDISLFLSLSRRPVIAVTGSKGKSSTAAAIHYAAISEYEHAEVGGNIARSPLEFVHTDHTDPVVLELSSWQLADLRGSALLAPEIAIVLNLLRDHQDRYPDLESYAADKRVICESQRPGQKCLLRFDDDVVKGFATATNASVIGVSSHPPDRTQTGGLAASPDSHAWLEDGEGYDTLGGSLQRNVLGHTRLPGSHNRLNLVFAAAALIAYGLEREAVCRSLERFPGIPHRLETVGDRGGVRYVNDTTATIPEATLAAVACFDAPVHLICGGADKKLDFSVLVSLNAASIHLLEGSATPRMTEALRETDSPLFGPFGTMEEAVESARAQARSSHVVLLSPGCASFGMFVNEFDRGDQFRDAVGHL